MPLIDLQTNLKSLGFGKDRPGEASSNQPYIVTPIPTGSFPTSPDFLLRNGYLNFINSLTDTERIGKWFGDVKSPSGLLFTTKQELLERQNPKLVNINRVYNPLSTLFQTGLVSTGGHLNKQGLNPSELGYYSGGKYGYYFSTKNQTIGDGIENRLTIAYTAKIANQELGPLTINPFGITNLAGNNILLSYPGGPGSILGIGRTKIRIQNSTRPVKNINKEDKFQPSFYNVDSTDPLYLTPGFNGEPFTPGWTYGRLFNNGASANYIQLFNDGTEDTRLKFNTRLFSLGNDKNRYLNRNISENILESKNDPFDNQYTLDYTQVIEQDSRGIKQNTSFQNILDFRKVINNNIKTPVLPSTDYSQFNRENQINTGDGAKGYGTSKTTYKGNFIADTGYILNPNQAISPDQTELGVTGEDIIDLNFTIDDPNSGEPNRLVDFRAYIESWSDGAKAEWSPIKYMGRAESLYKYNGFSRDVSITFLVPALSRADMVNNYKKLNALMWTVAPSYSSKTNGNTVVGLMRGSITKFTMGDYFNGMPCIIKSVDFSEIEGMGWDINRDENGKIITPDNEYYVGQLPKGIRVQISMTPIHNFVPQYGEAFIGWDNNYHSSIYTLPKSGKGFWNEGVLTNPYTAGYKFPGFVPKKINSENPKSTGVSTPQDLPGGTAFIPQPE